MFIPYSYGGETLTPHQYLPADDGTYTVGDALVLTGGHLQKASGAVKPSHIAMANKTIATDGEMLPVVAVKDGVIYESRLSVASASIARGTAYTIASDGACVTATAQGVFSVIDYDGKAAGDTVRGVFVDAPPAGTNQSSN